MNPALSESRRQSKADAAKPATDEKHAGGESAAKFAKRLVTSFCLVGFSAFILFGTNTFFFSLEVFAFLAAALYEFFTMLRRAKVPVYRLFGVVMGLIIPVVVYMEQGQTQSGEVLFLILGCLFLFLLQFSHTNNSEALVGISLTLLGILYVSWFLSFLIKIRFLEGGTLWVAYLLAVTKAGDIGAYASGMTLGRHSLIPHVSPKKSVEGLFGGLLASTLVSVWIAPYLPVRFGLGHALVLGVLIGMVGQIGDLAESLMKRFCNAKDSGNLLPGMGGIFDAIDSIIFTAPIFYFHLQVFL